MALPRFDHNRSKKAMLTKAARRPWQCSDFFGDCHASPWQHQPKKIWDKYIWYLATTWIGGRFRCILCIIGQMLENAEFEAEADSSWGLLVCRSWNHSMCLCPSYDWGNSCAGKNRCKNPCEKMMVFLASLVVIRVQTATLWYIIDLLS